MQVVTTASRPSPPGLCFASLFLFAALLTSAWAGPLQPNAGQRQLIERGYGMFIHFGVNTFNEIEWSDGTLPASSFNPIQLDCDQWIQTAKEAGFRHVILITKHHDGFCLWDSKFRAEKLRLRILEARAPASIHLITVSDSSTRGRRR